MSRHASAVTRGCHRWRCFRLRPASTLRTSVLDGVSTTFGSACLACFTFPCVVFCCLPSCLSFFFLPTRNPGLLYGYVWVHEAGTGGCARAVAGRAARGVRSRHESVASEFLHGGLQRGIGFGSPPARGESNAARNAKAIFVLFLLYQEFDNCLAFDT